MVLAVAVSAIVIILIVTVIVIYSQFQEKPYAPPTPSPVQQTAAPTAAPAPVQAGSTIAASELTSQIAYPSSKASSSATLRTALIAFGFKSVVPVTQNAVGSAQNLLFFSPRVDPQIRSSVTQVVQQIVPDIIVQEKADAAFDITVNLKN